tara:strand:- start:60 stop:263 length:204 start_codon:yes stop_codon:yes gene_type:complete
MKHYIIILSILLLTSCASIELFNKQSYITNITTTVGDELIDLQKALDSGVINQEEYDEMKEKILQRD